MTVDMLIFAVDNREDSIRLLLIKRKNHPFLGCWALPGGFVEITESLRDAAARELEEETGVKGMYLEQLYTFGETGRDPRSRIISVAYMAVIDGSGLKVQAGDCEYRCRPLFDVKEERGLAFDHIEAVRMGLDKYFLMKPKGNGADLS